MTENDAINVLIQAATIGQKHGIYSLKDSSMIYQAVCMLQPETVGQSVQQEPAAETAKNE